MRILSYGTPVFLLFCAYWSRIIQKLGGGGVSRYNFPLNKTSWKHLNITKVPAEAHSVIPSVNFLIKTVNIWWGRGWVNPLSTSGGGGGGLLPHIGYIGMCRCEVYGFQAVYSGTGIQIREFGSRIAYHFPGNWSVGRDLSLDEGNQELPLQNIKNSNRFCFNCTVIVTSVIFEKQQL